MCIHLALSRSFAPLHTHKHKIWTGYNILVLTMTIVYICIWQCICTHSNTRAHTHRAHRAYQPATTCSCSPWQLRTFIYKNVLTHTSKHTHTPTPTQRISRGYNPFLLTTAIAYVWMKVHVHTHSYTRKHRWWICYNQLLLTTTHTQPQNINRLQPTPAHHGHCRHTPTRHFPHTCCLYPLAVATGVCVYM